MAFDLNQLRVETLKRLIGGMQLKNFASQYDLDASYLSQILNGHRALGEMAATSLEKKLGLPTWSLTYPRASIKATPASVLSVRRIPIQGTAFLKCSDSWGDLTHASGWVDIPSNDPDAYAIRISGNSISPAICNGWVVWLEPNRTPMPGDYVIAYCTDDQKIIKKLLSSNSTTTKLQSLTSPDQIELAPHKIIKTHPIGGVTPPSKVLCEIDH